MEEGRATTGMRNALGCSGIRLAQGIGIMLLVVSMREQPITKMGRQVASDLPPRGALPEGRMFVL